MNEQQLFRRGYPLLFTVVFLFYFGIATLAPVFAQYGFTLGSGIIYKFYSVLCHQLPYRSFFLYGEQFFYPLQATGLTDIHPIELYQVIHLNTDVLSPRFFGFPLMGYKIALCERCLAVFVSLFLFTLVFMLFGRRFKRIPLWVWLSFGVAPLALDGFSQLLSRILPFMIPLRESTPLLRTITGVLFGIFSGWFLFPYLEQTLQAADKEE